MSFDIKLTPAEVADIVGGELIGSPSTPIRNLSKIENGQPGDLTFLYRDDYERYLEGCYASCILIPKGFIAVPKLNQSFIECENPYLSFIKILRLVTVSNSDKIVKKGEIHRSAIISSTAKIGKNVVVGARCYIGKNCIIADNVVLMPNVTLYDNVIIGEGTEINSNVVCYQDTIIGKNCIIHAGTVIGSDGFGFIENPEDGSYEKIPHIGNVNIGDNVEIGANSTIDRALIDSTIIENGVKIDNLVHIAHNCFIGAHSAMAAQVGISGSTKVGSRNRIGGQVGLAGHIELTDDVVVYAQSGIPKSINKKGAYFGSPAKEKMQAFKIEACLRRLPEVLTDVEVLKKSVFGSENNSE